MKNRSWDLSSTVFGTETSMKTLLTLLAFTLTAMLLGKVARKRNTGWYVMVILVSVLQVAAAIYLMSTMESPTS